MRATAVVSFYVVLALVLTGITSAAGSRFYAGPDPVQDVWILNWVARHLLTDPLHVFDGNCFYPSRDAILFSDPLLGPALLVAPLAFVVQNPVLLYNLAIVLVQALASYGFFRLAYRLSGDAPASLLAGIVIPHTAQQLQHLPHLNLLTSAGFPFLLLGLLRLVERPGPLPALAVGVAFAWQAGTSGYHAFSCAFIVAIFLAYHWRRFGQRRQLGFTALALLIAGLLLAPYVLGFLRLRGEADTFRRIETAREYGVDLAIGLFKSHSYLWHRLMPVRGGDALFPGLVALVFAGIGVKRGERRTVGLLAVVLAVFTLLALGPDLKLFGRVVMPLPFRVLYEHVPFFDAVRHPVTFAFPATMALGLLAVIGLSSSGVSRRPKLLALVLAAAVAETLTPPPLRVARSEGLPDVYRFLETQPAGGILEMPFDDSRWQWWAVHHGLPIVNGMAAFEPRGYAPLVQVIAREWKADPARDMEGMASLGRLKALFPIRYLILHRESAAPLKANVAASPESFELLYETGDGDRAYRVRRSGRGQFLRRAFREDQLRGGRIVASVRGPDGAILHVDLNETALGAHRLAGVEQRAVWQVPARSVERGLNRVVFHVMTAGASFELLELETEGPPGPARPQNRSSAQR